VLAEAQSSQHAQAVDLAQVCECLALLEEERSRSLQQAEQMQGERDAAREDAAGQRGQVEAM